jgi:hypothetical protein
MTDRPIIFSGSMVRALLDGRKTQTRRILKPQPKTFRITEDGVEQDAPVILHHTESEPWPKVAIGRVITRQEVRYRPGMRLWVREAHATSANPDLKPWYRLDHPEATAAGPRVDVKWRPSIHMPRWASRFTLNVTAVRVERLQQISEADAMAEGMINLGGRGVPDCWWHSHDGLSRAGATARAAFGMLWDDLHGAGAWDANPWVVAITFGVAKRNIDEAAP